MISDHSRLGIMQGRLSPPIGNLIQAFPKDHWEKELELCGQLGLGCIEWIYELPNLEYNPLHQDDKITELMSISSKNAVRINSVVADYFMVKKLFSEPEPELKNNISILNHLIMMCSKAEIPILELPFVDNSSLKTESDRNELIKNLSPSLELAQENNVKISFETSLPPDIFLRLIQNFKPLNVFVNYDMGNSASLGFDAKEEIRLLGDFIINVHIKDRVLGGGTVPLGQGSTDFETVFSELKRINYQGDYILQAARQDLSNNAPGMNYRDTIKSYIQFVDSFLGV